MYLNYIWPTQPVLPILLSSELVFIIFDIICSGCSEHNYNILSQIATNTNYFGKTNKKEIECKKMYLKLISHPGWVDQRVVFF